MLIRRRIRSLMYLGVTLLCVIVASLSFASIQGVLKFRKLTKNIRGRATELPLTADLSHKVNKLRATLIQCRPVSMSPGVLQPMYSEQIFPRYDFKINLQSVEAALGRYHQQLVNNDTTDPRIADTTLEREIVSKMQSALVRVHKLIDNRDWDLGGGHSRNELEDELEGLQVDTSNLPSLMKDRMDAFAEEARVEYHAWLVMSVVTMSLGILLLALLSMIFRRRIFVPLDRLLVGSRKVASGNFDYRIKMATNDEMAELAESFNAMTANFQEIKQDLNRQVQLRTKEVVRSEQMASVGFLAAGVAHEINNPLATIAWSAESLESRLLEILDPTEAKSIEERAAEIESMKKYLRRIQDEAFRCKGITGSLLDFSRLGDAKQSPTQLNELVQAVIDMVRPLGRYRRRNIEFESGAAVVLTVKPQEMKQVVLNLITNALDSVDDGGTVHVRLDKRGDWAELQVQDNGCGMSEEVLHHLFEPFFTKRRDGQGTGLGLSITYRIIEEHGGSIEPFSDGPGKGSTFKVTLPINQNDQKQATRNAA